MPQLVPGMDYGPQAVSAAAGYHAAIVHAHNLFQSCYGMSPKCGFMPAAVPVWGAYPVRHDAYPLEERPMAREARVLRC